MAAQHPFTEDLKSLAEHYRGLLREFGDGPQVAQWSDVETQERRLRVLCEVGDLRTAKILDFGCGLGHLLTLLREDFAFRGEYVGIDVSEELVDAARRKHADARFDCRDVLSTGIDEEFDFVFISGVFNNRLQDNSSFIRSLLSTLFPVVRKALAFNALSTYVQFQDPRLWYADPMEIFRFCKEHLSPLVTLRHDYEMRSGVIPYEFSIYVRATKLLPLKPLGK